MRLLRRPTLLTAKLFAQLYEEYLGAVFNYCLFRVGDRQLAEDLTAETFEQLWRDRSQYDPEQANLTTWLFALARHRIIDRQRQQGRVTLVTLEADDGQYIDAAPLPEEQAARNERLAKLQKLVQELPAEHKELIALKFGAGLTNRRIAELLGKGESAVGSALYRIMQKLREQWEEVNVQTQER